MVRRVKHFRHVSENGPLWTYDYRMKTPLTPLRVLYSIDGPPILSHHLSKTLNIRGPSFSIFLPECKDLSDGIPFISKVSNLTSMKEKLINF